MAEPTTSRVNLTLDSTIETVSRVEQEVEQFAARAGFSEDDIPNIAMAAREATVNAVLHGNAYSPDKKVRLSMEMLGDELRIVVTDEGKGFDPDNLPDPLAPENILRGSGRGIFLVKAFMDEVNFRNNGTGTEVVLAKRLSRDSKPNP